MIYDGYSNYFIKKRDFFSVNCTTDHSFRYNSCISFLCYGLTPVLWMTFATIFASNNSFLYSGQPGDFPALKGGHPYQSAPSVPNYSKSKPSKVDREEVRLIPIESHLRAKLLIRSTPYIARFIFSRFAPKWNCASYRSWFIHFQPINSRVTYLLSINNVTDGTGQG